MISEFKPLVPMVEFHCRASREMNETFHPNYLALSTIHNDLYLYMDQVPNSPHMVKYVSYDTRKFGEIVSTTSEPVDLHRSEQVE